MSQRNLRLHIVRETGWEREDFRTYQENRVRLVQMLDKFLVEAKAREKSGPANLLLGGQAVELDDYLEIRPVLAPTIVDLARREKIELGPWYVLPDDSLSSEEALIRNLLIGASKAAQYGADRTIGYLDGQAGHIAQLPQLALGFNITACVIVLSGKAIGAFQWSAPDGNRIDLINAYDGQHDTFSGGKDADVISFELKNLARNIKAEQTSEVLTLIHSGPDGTSGVPGVSKSAPGEHVKGISFDFETLAEALRALNAQGDSRSVFSGSLVGPYSASTRIHLKQRNHAIQSLLTNWDELLEAWVSCYGSSPEQAGQYAPEDSLATATRLLIRHAWQIALQNHRPLTIGGQISDQTNREVLARYDHAEQIGEAITQQLLSTFARSVDTITGAASDSVGAIIVTNPSASQRSGVVDIPLARETKDLPVEIYDVDGNPVACIMHESNGRGADARANEQTLARILAVNVPPLGYRAYSFRYSESATNQVVQDQATSIENEALHVQVDPANGTLSVFDKRTGRSFAGLNHFVDDGDCGDAFTYCAPAHDTVIDIATNTPIYVERTVSPVEQTLSFLQIYRIPRQLTDQRDARLPLAAQFVPVSILTQIRLTPGVPRVDVVAKIANSALDHRLRVHFPAGGGFGLFLVDTPFAVEEYALDTSTKHAHQTITQGRFATLLGADTGLTIANRGLPEIEALTIEGLTEIALTLMRCVGWLSRDDLPNRQGHAGHPLEIPDGQCLGDHEFHYSIIPHGPDKLAAWEEACNYQVDMRAEVVEMQAGALPTSGSLLVRDNPAFVVTSIKIADNSVGVIARGYNITNSPINVTLQPGFQVSQAKRARIDETPFGKAKSPNPSGGFSFKLGPAEILTVIFYQPKR